jgi:hypothetical protein
MEERRILLGSWLKRKKKENIGKTYTDEEKTILKWILER